MKKRVLSLNEYEEWYKNNLCMDFPINEIKPLEAIINLKNQEKYDIIAYYDKNDFLIGYATVWKEKGNLVYLLDYLGVPESMRNRGIGMRILKSLKETVEQIENKHNICLILESETPLTNDDSAENIIRKRRIGFYERNGWLKMYEMATCGMRFNAMSYEVMPDNLDITMQQHKQIYGEKRTDAIIPLLEGEKPPLPYWMKDNKN